MELIVINKKVNALNKATCSCGWVKFSTTGLEIDHLAVVHAKDHPESRTVQYYDGKQVNYSGRRAIPGRSPRNMMVLSAGDDGNFAHKAED